LLPLLEYGLVEPLLEADLAESRVVGRNQRALAEFGPEVPRVRVGDHFTPAAKDCLPLFYGLTQALEGRTAFTIASRCRGRSAARSREIQNDKTDELAV
jgi:hypothetical protein